MKVCIPVKNIIKSLLKKRKFKRRCIKIYLKVYQNIFQSISKYILEYIKIYSKEDIKRYFKTFQIIKSEVKPVPQHPDPASHRFFRTLNKIILFHTDESNTSDRNFKSP